MFLVRCAQGKTSIVYYVGNSHLLTVVYFSFDKVPTFNGEKAALITTGVSVWRFNIVYDSTE